MNATDLSPITFGLILPLKLRGKLSTNSQINPVNSDENKNSKVRTIKILLNSGAIASIVRKDVLHECHKILQDKKNKWSIMAGMFNTTVCLQTSDRDFTVTLSPPELLGRFSSFLFLTTRLIELHGQRLFARNLIHRSRRR